MQKMRREKQCLLIQMVCLYLRRLVLLRIYGKIVAFPVLNLLLRKEEAEIKICRFMQKYILPGSYL